MGLLELFKKKEEKPLREEPNLVNMSTKVNLTEKSVKVKVPDDEEGEMIRGVYLWQDEGVIRGLLGEKVIFEIGKRSKAYDELQPFVRKKSNYVLLKKCHGDYGVYYQLKVSVRVTREEAGMKP